MEFSFQKPAWKTEVLTTVRWVDEAGAPVFTRDELLVGRQLLDWVDAGGNPMDIQASCAAWPSTVASMFGEDRVLVELSQLINCDKSFIEFGFDSFQMNCGLLIKEGFKGLLIDGDTTTPQFMEAILGFHDYNKVIARCELLKRDNLDTIFNFTAENDNKLGVLSIDIDGNDYWICEKIVERIKPDIIMTEYNASFGKRPIAVPYDDENIDRHEKHPSGWYHGASIVAFKKLLENDYALVGNVDGLDIVFVRKDLMVESLESPASQDLYKEQEPRNRMWKNNASDQWAEIKHLPYVEV